MTDDITRCDVLRGLGGLALTGAIGCGELDPSEPGEPAVDIDRSLAGRCATATIAAVANQARVIDSVEAYAEKQVDGGETIGFRVSSPVPYQLSIVRLGWDTDTPARDWTLTTFPQAPASQQSIHPGSYVHVETALNPTATFTQLTLDCWVRPFRELGGSYWQGLMSQHTNPVGGVGQCGFGLFLSDSNVPYLYFGNGGAFNSAWLRWAPSPLSKLEWHHVAAVFDAGTARLYVDGVLVDSASGFPAAVTPGPAPLRLGAYGDSTGTSFFLDGDLAMPVIYSRALSDSEIATRAGVRPPQVPVDSAVIGCWPFDEERGAVVADVSGCGRTGTIVNHGTWMIGGPGFNAVGVDRFKPYNPDTDATRGHGLRLSWTDLYDCGWPCTQSYTLPSDCLPGVYVGRIIYTDPNDQTVRRYDVTFVVRRATSRPHAPVLVLCNTSTWLAYNRPFGLFSLYDNHGLLPAPTPEDPEPVATGQPTYYQGIEMPWTHGVSDIVGETGANPYLRYFDGLGVNYSHLVLAERHLHVWLEMNGYDYDVVSDRDLLSDPSILSNYRTIFIAGHSEYWTQEGWSAVRSYLASGGNVIVASGNTMFWRVSYDDSVMECRKKGQAGGERPNAEWGELYHEHDHQRGGLMREAGCPGWQAIGLESVGYDGNFFPYKVTEPTHAFFQTPETIAVEKGTELGGEFAVGHEWDARLDSIPRGSHPPPAIPPDYTPVTLAKALFGQTWDYAVNFVQDDNLVMSEIVEWVWGRGGRVFSAGSIAASQALHADANMAALFRNALHHNGVVFRLNILAIGQNGHFELKAFDGSAWSAGWDDHGAGFGAGFAGNPPTGVQWAPNSLAAMAITPVGSLYYKYNVGAGWNPWNDFGGTFQGRPAAVGWGRNRLDLFARGLDNHLYQKAWDGSTFTDWVDLGGSVGSDPAAISWEGNRLSVAVLGTTGSILYRNNINGIWSPGWTDMGATGAPFTAAFAYAPTMVVFGGNRLAVFAVDTAGRAWVKHWDGATWYPSLTGWVDLGWGGLASRVHVASWAPDTYTVFGVGRDGRLKTKGWDGSAWEPSQTGWDDLGGSLVGEPAVASYRGSHLSVCGVGPDGHVQHILWNGFAWSEWQDFGGTMRESPAVFRWVAT